LARQDDVQAAIAMWRPAFARNEDVIGLARNLAAAYCHLGDEAGARETMADALRFSPGVRKAWSFSCGADK